MPKGMVEGNKATTSLVGLREMIRELEIGLAALRGKGQDVARLLHLRDRAGVEVERFEQEEGMDLRPERTRLDTVDNIIQRRTPAIMYELRASGGLAAIRQAENPPEERWWWFVDLNYNQQVRRRLIRSSAIFVGIVVLLLAFNYVMDKRFGLTPTQKEARGLASSAESYIMQGNLADAKTDFEKAVAVDPTMGDAQAQLGVLYELDGQTDKAQAAYAAAEAAIQDRVLYLLTLARAYQNVAQLDKALSLCDEALALDPESPHATLTRGGIYEDMGDNVKALDDYERAGSLASARGEDALYVLSRTRMGMLLQRGPNRGPSPASGS